MIIKNYTRLINKEIVEWKTYKRLKFQKEKYKS